MYMEKYKETESFLQINKEEKNSKKQILYTLQLV